MPVHRQETHGQQRGLFYAYCRCGVCGPLCVTREKAKEDDRHLAGDFRKSGKPAKSQSAARIIKDDLVSSEDCLCRAIFYKDRFAHDAGEQTHPQTPLQIKYFVAASGCFGRIPTARNVASCSHRAHQRVCAAQRVKEAA
jgi:hypothetical protein